MSYRILISRALAVALIAAIAGKVFACGGSYGMNCAIGDDEQLQMVIKDGFTIKDGHPSFKKDMTDKFSAKEFARELVKHTPREGGWELPPMP